MRNENISILTSDLSARHGVLCPDGGVGFPRWGFFQILCYFFFFFMGSIGKKSNVLVVWP